MRIRKVAIVGAGTMGCSIAESIGEKGFQVFLVDRTDELVEDAKCRVELSLNKRLEKWGITEAEKRITLSRIHFTSKPEDAATCDLIIEAVQEDANVKKRVLSNLDKVCHPLAILASNTSTLSITELAAATQRPEKVIGLHFLSPVVRVEVVEIVRGLKSSEQTVEAVKRFVKSLDKIGVEVNDSPGFVTTRLITPLLNQAMNSLMEGVASASDIDTAIRLGFGLPRGPLEMADRMGLDTVLTSMEGLFRDLGDFSFRPCPLLRKLVRAGHLGVKTGQGFFKYDEEGNLVETEENLVYQGARG
ncbi:MAG: NAD-binding protein [Firmicutes bacterium]|nr:NAD-binding protein [Bacillota bacterium]